MCILPLLSRNKGIVGQNGHVDWENETLTTDVNLHVRMMRRVDAQDHKQVVLFMAYGMTSLWIESRTLFIHRRWLVTRIYLVTTE